MFPCKERSQSMLIFSMLLFMALPLDADWPQWRGPNRDGVSSDFLVPPKWPASLKENWKVTVGEGHSSPVVSNGKVYLLTRQGEDEVVLSLDSATGREIWKATHKYFNV